MLQKGMSSTVRTSPWQMCRNGTWRAGGQKCFAKQARALGNIFSIPCWNHVEGYCIINRAVNRALWFCLIFPNPYRHGYLLWHNARSAFAKRLQWCWRGCLCPKGAYAWQMCSHLIVPWYDLTCQLFRDFFRDSFNMSIFQHLIYKSQWSHPRCDCAVGPLKFIMSNLRPRRMLDVNLTIIFLVVLIKVFFWSMSDLKKIFPSALLSPTESCLTSQGYSPTWRTETRHR